MKQKFETKNRYGLKIVGELWMLESPSGLSFVMHGLGGFKEQEAIQTISRVLYENNYVVVNFDATNSFGESEGIIIKAKPRLSAGNLGDLTVIYQTSVTNCL